MSIPLSQPAGDLLRHSGQTLEATRLQDGSEHPIRLRFYLWGVVLSLGVFDIATTVAGLQSGFVETNPMALVSLEALGVWGLLTLKIGALGIGVFLASRNPGLRLLVPATYAMAWGVACILNLLTLVS